MTKKQFRKSVSEVAKKMLSKHGLRWQDINTTNLPTIEIGHIWSCQGEDASELIDNCPADLNFKSYILWYLESAGAI